MADRIGEITGIASPKSIGRRFEQKRTSRKGLGDDLVGFFLAMNVVCKRYAAKTGSLRWQAGILSQSVRWIECQPRALELKNCNTLTFLVSSWLPETIPVEGHRPVQAGDPESDNADSRFHMARINEKGQLRKLADLKEQGFHKVAGFMKA